MTSEIGDGPLRGLKVVEFTSIGPGPYAAMLLSDLGADVLRIDRSGGNGWPNPIIDRGRASITVDLQSAEGRDKCLAMIEHADVLIEGFRPGVMERLGLGPDICAARNERLVYGRMTGWGQDGPLARSAGHDINYIAMTGALAAMGKPGEPAAIPLNLVGDFGGGTMFLVFGIMAALWERERSGKGQVVDAAIVDGVSSMMGMFAGLIPAGLISLERDANLLGGAVPFYRNYLCRCGGEMSVGPLEPKFFGEMVEKLGHPELAESQYDKERWPMIEQTLETRFASESRAYWVSLFAGSDACVFPVLSLDEAISDPHLVARKVYVERAGLMQAAPAPRFSRTPGAIQPDRTAAAMLEGWQQTTA